jgi:hypothetical protein
VKQEDYEHHWSQLSHEKRRLLDERTSLETSLSEIKTQIAHLDEVLDHLAPLAGISIGKDISKLGITDAIRLILKDSSERMSAAEVRSSLAEKGFDLSGLTAPMSSIYKVLGRLVDDSQEATREKDEDGFRVFFRWIQPESEIDDDIPF